MESYKPPRRAVIILERRSDGYAFEAFGTLSPQEIEQGLDHVLQHIKEKRQTRSYFPFDVKRAP